MIEFTHLHLHTEYSILDSVNRIPAIIDRVKESGMKAVSITDHGTMAGWVEFQKECKGKNVKPILGIEAYQSIGSRFDKSGYYHLILLAANDEGRKNLMRLSYHAASEGFYRKPRIDKEVLRSLNSGIICLSACLASEVSAKILANDPDWISEEGKFEDVGTHLEAIEWYKEVFGDRYFLELQLNTISHQNTVNAALIDAASSLDIPLVFTNDCHYTKPHDCKFHEACFALRDNKLLTDPKRYRFSGEGYWIKTPAEIEWTITEQVPAEKRDLYLKAAENTQLVAERCNTEVPTGKFFFPAFPYTVSYEDDLKKKCEEGLKERGLDLDQRYKDRLAYELTMINQMGFAPYFLVVTDFVNWAKENDIPVGAGRGSGAGCLAAYTLKITEVDPVLYNLYFERFINPHRVSLPDFDIDFADRDRARVLDYVRTKYGHSSCANISTYGTMAAKGAVRAAGLVLGTPQEIIDEAASYVPEDYRGKHAKLVDVRIPNSAGSDVKAIFELARQFEDLIRTRSTHASGIVIAPGHITDYVPVCKTKTNDLACEWDMGAVEEAGLVKLDFLGLRNLSVVKDCIDLIEKRHNVKLEMTKIPVDDAKTFHNVSSGNVMGVFQLEASAGIRDLTIKVKPQSIEQWSDLVALYRPGPLDTITNDYVERCSGRQEVSYPLDIPELIEVLKPTYGLYVYQEQILRIAQIVSGYSLAEADLLRRCIKKGSFINTDLGVFSIEKTPLGSTHNKRIFSNIWKTSDSKSVYRISTWGYPDIYLSSEHVVSTDIGDISVEQLCEDKHRFLEVDPNPIFGNLSLDRDILLLGTAVICEGHHVENRSTTFVNSNDSFIRLVKEAADRLKIDYTDYIFENNVKSVSFNRVFDDKVKIKKGLSESKELPENWLRLSKENLLYVLSILFESEGYFTKTHTIGFSTTSFRLYEQVQIILYLFKIRFATSIKDSISKSGYSYSIDICDSLEVNKLLMLLQQNAVGIDSKFADQVCQNTTNSGCSHLIPGHLWREFVLFTKNVNNLKWKDIPSKFRNGGFLKPKYGISHRKASEFISFLDSIGANYNLPDNYFNYAKLSSITLYDKLEEVYDFAEDTEHYGTVNGYKVHNSIGKKKPEEMAKQRDRFINGRRPDTTEEQATNLFNDIEKFSEYGFNKSHSIAYALLGYWTAYLKVNYPVEFQTALINSEVIASNDIEARATYIGDSINQGIKVIRPSAKNPTFECSPLDDKTIILGMGVIKGISQKTAEHIIELAQQRPFNSVQDFLFRVSPSIIKSNIVSLLAQAGFFDCFIPRWRLLPVIDKVRDACITLHKNNIQSVDSLASFLEIDSKDLPFLAFKSKASIDVDALRSHENNCFGFSLSYASAPKIDISDHIEINKSQYSETLVGKIAKLRSILTKSGKPMAFMSLQTETDLHDIVIFPNVYRIYAQNLREGELYVVQVSYKDGKILNAIEPLSGVLRRFGYSVKVTEFNPSIIDLLGSKYDLWQDIGKLSVGLSTDFTPYDMVFLLTILGVSYEILVIG